MRILTVICLMIGTSVSAESLSLALPSAPGSYQSDSFRAGDLDCSNAIGSATRLETGVTGIIANGKDEFGTSTGNRAGDIGVYARIVIPLGKRVKSRIDCNRLYELELRKKQLEVMKLEQELKQLRALQFEE